MLRAETHRASAQIRPGHPFPDEEPHPRCREMAETMRDLAASHSGVKFLDLVAAGYSCAEITEHADAARALANSLSERQTTPRPDLVADMIDKARAPMPNRLPLPRGAKETQALLVAWSHYCAARQALVLDPWTGQRDRCLSTLWRYLNQMPLFHENRVAVVAAVDATLPRVTQ